MQTQIAGAASLKAQIASFSCMSKHWVAYQLTNAAAATSTSAAAGATSMITTTTTTKTTCRTTRIHMALLRLRRTETRWRHEQYALLIVHINNFANS